MRCMRCSGFMVLEPIHCASEGEVPPHFRCVNCGKLWDKQIEENSRKPPLPDIPAGARNSKRKKTSYPYMVEGDHPALFYA